jgi:hypothetical protein
VDGVPDKEEVQVRGSGGRGNPDEGGRGGGDSTWDDNIIEVAE